MNDTNQKQGKTKEIDIIGLLKAILSNKKELGVCMLVGAVLGVVVALNTEKKYTSNVVLAPELGGASGLGGGLSDIASMVGVNLNSGGMSVDAIYPEIYPDVMSSSDFIVSLFDVPVTRFKENDKKTYYEHIRQDSKMPFWSYPMYWLTKLMPKKDLGGNADTLSTFWLTKDQYDACNAIRGNISCIVDKKTSVISISVTDIDRLVSAIIADTIQSRLQEYIVRYRTKKARNDLQYAEKLLVKARNEYIDAQQAYARFADANYNITLEELKTKRDRLENDMQLKFNVYNQTALQVQTAKAKIQERTPAFTVVQGASVPMKASSTPRSFIVIVFVFLGIFAEAIWVLYIKEYYMAKKKK